MGYMVDPIKSCGGYKIPVGVSWEIRPHGFALDREWCLVHLGTGTAIDQKRYNKMALIRPVVDLIAGTLTVSIHNSPSVPPLLIPLSSTPSDLCTIKHSASRVCGDKITALTYNSPHIIDFFSAAVGVPCTLARFPAGLGSGGRRFKPHLAKEQRIMQENVQNACARGETPILLSNESPILIINRSSVEELNALIGCTGGKQAKPDVFRANIVIRETGGGGAGKPYAEDGWRHVRIGREYFEVGICSRYWLVGVNDLTVGCSYWGHADDATWFAWIKKLRRKTRNRL